MSLGPLLQAVARDIGSSVAGPVNALIVTHGILKRLMLDGMALPEGAAADALTSFSPNSGVTVVKFALPSSGESVDDFVPEWRLTRVLNCGLHIGRPGPDMGKD